MHWFAVAFLCGVCLLLASVAGNLANDIARLEWQLRRVECKANGMAWVAYKDGMSGYCRTADVAAGK
jgi:hypothetical protein